MREEACDSCYIKCGKALGYGPNYSGKAIDLIELNKAHRARLTRERKGKKEPRAAEPRPEADEVKTRKERTHGIRKKFQDKPAPGRLHLTVEDLVKIYTLRRTIRFPPGQGRSSSSVPAWTQR